MSINSRFGEVDISQLADMEQRYAMHELGELSGGAYEVLYQSPLDRLSEEVDSMADNLITSVADLSEANEGDCEILIKEEYKKGFLIGGYVPLPAMRPDAECFEYRICGFNEDDSTLLFGEFETFKYQNGESVGCQRVIVKIDTSATKPDITVFRAETDSPEELELFMTINEISDHGEILVDANPTKFCNKQDYVMQYLNTGHEQDDYMFEDLKRIQEVLNIVGNYVFEEKVRYIESGYYE